jgi:hypothetical protein
MVTCAIKKIQDYNGTESDIQMSLSDQEGHFDEVIFKLRWE